MEALNWVGGGGGIFMSDGKGSVSCTLNPTITTLTITSTLAVTGVVTIQSSLNVNNNSILQTASTPILSQNDTQSGGVQFDIRNGTIGAGIWSLTQAGVANWITVAKTTGNTILAGANTTISGTSTLTGNVTVGNFGTVATPILAMNGTGLSTFNFVSSNASNVVHQIGSYFNTGAGFASLDISSGTFTIHTAGALTLTLDTSQGATFAKGVSFGVTTSFPTGSIGVSTTNGLTLIGNPGSSVDMALTNGTGLVAASIPTGTQNFNVVGTLNTGANVTAGGSVTSNSPSAGVGYATGAGGAVTQLTNKATGVTLNKVSGAITMNNSSLLSAAAVSFNVTNSTVAVTDVPQVAVATGQGGGPYEAWISAVGTGSFQVTVRNNSGGTLSDALVINFVVLKSVNS